MSRAGIDADAFGAHGIAVTAQPGRIDDLPEGALRVLVQGRVVGLRPRRNRQQPPLA